MADNQDKLSPKDQKMLEDLEKQLSKTASVSQSTASTKKPTGMGDQAPPKQPTMNTQKSESQPVAAKAKTGFLWFFTLLNLLLLTGVIVAAYWGWLQWQNQTEAQQQFVALQESSLAKQQAEIQQSIAANQLVQSDWQQQSQAEQDRLNVMASAIEQNSQQAASTLNKVNEIAGRRPADWLLAEANYLLNMAGRKLWLEHDVATSLLMLQAADGRLQDMNDTSLLMVREKLAADMYTLQQLNPLSTTNLALEISGLSKQVASLPLTFFQKPEDLEASSDIVNDDNDWYTNLVNSISQVLKGFFSVKKITTEVKPFMSEQQQWLVKEQLKFTLVSAQTALLQQQSVVFEEQLNNALRLVNEHFDTTQSNVMQFTESLQRLRSSEVEQTYPQQFTASNALQDIINDRLGNRFTNGNN
ncbi:uroporphyrinogen-III C-methyltransferase [Flavobacterium sp. W21_SRS_FM6]|uniref:uroporphyrinogen-III C-methyltransferase n=1 Tax=Flavobacterium sp. W21_SRS_FM6 TaxID=3240268 RepID=UPI003F90DCA2